MVIVVVGLCIIFIISSTIYLIIKPISDMTDIEKTDPPVNPNPGGEGGEGNPDNPNPGEE